MGGWVGVLGGADGSDGDDDREHMKSAVAALTFQRGDSLVCESDPDLEGGEGEGEAAVAADDAQPNKEKRSKRQPRDITPMQQQLKSKWAGRNDAEHVGNIGWLFGNWASGQKV